MSHVNIEKYKSEPMLLREILPSLLNEKGFSCIQYDPPFESPIEEIFAWNMSKFLSEKIRLEKQVVIRTLWGNFRADFMITTDTEKIIFECDGKEYHNAGRDEWRDALILGSSDIDYVYRFRGS